ncbi:MAG: hypothetical protein EBV65_02770 [Gammaproteobacteria bacterium]|nr:hypothetical protein [Gammaproteobacteria bacterium]NBP06890.1 hypothetical protein [Gammaproteobacteria bacterium]NBR16735.1 hypothetical protein [Gammaproteobacteria bacterium]NCW20699.1 hypothetical protein [Gammaproteobacteria bacterium]NCW56585.1 hypothetical protein [Gammaproteobacteria bacterium]
MRDLTVSRRRVGLISLIGLLAALPAAAHLMEDQQGTLNIVDARGYLVISLPVSALRGVDDNRDGRLDGRELQRHAAAIERDLRARVRIADGEVAVPLEGVLLNLSADEQHREGGPATHLVMLAVAMFPQSPRRPRLELRVFGRSPAERTYRFVATRRSASGRSEEDLQRFTPRSPRHEFFE